MDQEEAMIQYVALLAGQNAEWEDHEVLKAFEA